MVRAAADTTPRKTQGERRDGQGIGYHRGWPKRQTTHENKTPVVNGDVSTTLRNVIFHRRAKNILSIYLSRRSCTAKNVSVVIRRQKNYQNRKRNGETLQQRMVAIKTLLSRTPD